MIEKIHEFQKLNLFKEENIFTVRIKSLAKSYGFDFSFASFYRQIENGLTTAVFSVLDSDITLAVDVRIADTDELANFFMLQGFTSLLSCDDFIFDCEYEHGVVMVSDRKYELSNDLNVISLTSFEQLRNLYDFLEYGGSFDVWYTDIRRRINKSTAEACGIYRNGKIVSSAILSSVYNSNAVLTGVKTYEKFRNNGFAGAVVKYICNRVKGKVYLMREEGKNEKFYSEIGFKNIDRWRIYR